MKIQWHKVTWYSKLIALVIFVVFPFIGFYWGIQYGVALEQARSLAANNLVVASSSQVSALPEYYMDPAEWQTDQNNNGGFSIAYPLDFDTQDNYSASPTTDWSLNSSGATGRIFFTLTIPRVFEPQTNFVGATLTVGSSRAPSALTNCLGDATSTATVNGIQFSVYHFTGVGAGNYYETTSYRTTHAGQCYSVEYTIHSGQIANYPAQYDLHQFDDVTITSVLDNIVHTFQFE